MVPLKYYYLEKNVGAVSLFSDNECWDRLAMSAMGTW